MTSRPTAQRHEYRHLVSVPVRWGDVDMLGHVNNVQFLRYAEEARVTWIRRFAADPAQLFVGEGLILADIQCSFIRQLRWPATVEIGVRAEKLGRSSMTLLNPIFVAGEDSPVATARAIVVWFDYQQQKTTPLPEKLRQAIREFEVVPPQE